MKHLLTLIFIVSLITFGFLLSLDLVTRDTGYFLQKFTENNVYRNFSGNKEEAERNFRDVQQYILLQSNYLDTQFFSREDLIHLKDVRSLYALIHIALAVTFLLLAGFAGKLKAEKLVVLTKKSVIAYILLAVIVLVAVNANFSGFFIFFHQIVFPRGYWQLDPQSSNLIKYFLNNIFQVTFLRICFSAAVIISLSYIFSIIYLKQRTLWTEKRLQKS